MIFFCLSNGTFSFFEIALGDTFSHVLSNLLPQRQIRDLDKVSMNRSEMFKNVGKNWSTLLFTYLERWSTTNSWDRQISCIKSKRSTFDFTPSHKWCIFHTWIYEIHDKMLGNIFKRWWNLSCLKNKKHKLLKISINFFQKKEMIIIMWNNNTKNIKKYDRIKRN